MGTRWSERCLVAHDRYMWEASKADAALLDAALQDLPFPPLPDDVDEDDEPVVIARWAGPRWGALLYVINNGFDEDLGEVTVDLDATSFRRLPDGWEESSGSGGGGWWTADRPLLRPPELPARTWQLHHFHSGPDDGWHAAWAYAVAAAEAAWVEVTDVDGTVRRPLEAPLGYFVIAWNGDGPAAVEVLDHVGNSLGRRELPQ